MAPSLLYCSECGAANALDQSTCFACQRTLVSCLPANGQIGLLHERYQMLTQVGAGGFGAVYKALDVQKQQYVAIKQINLRGLTPQEIIEATDGFNREVQILSTLAHAHLPRIHAHFTDPEHWYIVMDFIEGETLEYYLRDTTSPDDSAIRALTLDEVLDIGLQLCNVLAYLHTHQPAIIFRDLKPSNLMRATSGQFYLIDFGIARYFKPGQARDTIPLGSPGYAAPEQYGRAQTTPRADIYSLGALLHHLLSRHDPSETPFTFAPLHLSTSKDLGELQGLVLRMVEQDLERRPASIAEVESTLLHVRNLYAAEPRIWRPLPGQVQAPPVLARGAYQPVHVRQQLAQKAAQKRKTRRKFLVGGLALASTAGLGGFSYWRYWHPARLLMESKFPKQIQVPTKNDVSTIAWSPDGQHVAFGLSDGSVVGNHLSNADGFAITSSFAFKPGAQSQPVTLLAWSPDSSVLAAVSHPGQLELWHLGQQKGLTLSVGTNSLKAVAWSPNNRSIAVIDEQGALYLGDLRTGVASAFGNQSWQASGPLAWSPDGKSIIAFSADNTPQIQDVNSPSALTALYINTSSPVKTLIWSPDGQFIALLSIDGYLQVLQSQKQFQQVFAQGIATQQNQLAWSPDNRFLASIDDANNLLILDRSSGNTLVSVTISDPLGRGCTFPGNCLTWLPDSQHIVVANNNMECWLWSLPWF